MPRETWDAIESLWRAGRNAHQIAGALGCQYKTAWYAVRRLEAYYAEA
jgi:hypothetical protein